jgi:hypothetical protein
MAIAALVCGIVGLLVFFLLVVSVVALVLGLVAASKAKRSELGPAAGLGMARAGWILGAVGVALFAVFVTLAATGVIEDDEIDVTDLDPGDCVELDVGAEEIRELPRTECDEPHDGEVYLVDDVQLDREEYPGLSAIAAEIDERCTGEAFEDYVGTPYLRSELAYSYLYPVESGWERGDREFVCVAVEADGSTLFESVEGSRR